MSGIEFFCWRPTLNGPPSGPPSRVKSDDRPPTLLRVFHRDRSRPAAAEGGGVGQEVRRATVGAGDAEPGYVVRVEIEERRRATGRDPSELDERLVERDLRLALSGEVNAGRNLGLA